MSEQHKLVKASGIRREDGSKDYELSYGGVRSVASKDGGFWYLTLGDDSYRRRTVRELKEDLIGWVDRLGERDSQVSQGLQSSVLDEDSRGKADFPGSQGPADTSEALTVDEGVRGQGGFDPGARGISEQPVDLGLVGDAPGQWTCIDPCALLILCRVPMSSEVLRTLDAYGYLNPDGNPDIDGALREFHLKYQRPLEQQQQEAVATLSGTDDETPF